jgi:hypothetical protein
MRLHKASLALATVIAAMAGASAFDNASAQCSRERPCAPDNIGPKTMPNYGVLRASQPNQSLPSATSRPSNRDMRGVPSTGGRGMRGGMGGGRMNGAMGRR